MKKPICKPPPYDDSSTYSGSGFGLARMKQEGTPAHPEDVYIHCGCEKCEKRWQQQLKAYNDFHNQK